MSARCAGNSETENGQEQGELRAVANKATMFQPVRGFCEAKDGGSTMKSPCLLLAPANTYLIKAGFRLTIRFLSFTKTGQALCLPC